MTGRRRILLVEDEYMIAEDMACDLRALGAEVVGPIATVAEALEAVESEAHLDGAVLDMNLRGEMVFPVADALRERKVPILFTTGYESGTIPTRYADIERCEKPVTPARLRKAAASVLHLGA